MRLPDPPILVITDRKLCAEPLEARAEALFRGGCRWLSVRENDLDSIERVALLRRLIVIGRDFEATVGVHRDIAAAKTTGAALHLPAGSSPISVRHELGKAVLLGQSCHDADELKNTVGIDYATLSPVFRSGSKPGYGPWPDVADLRRLVAAASTPVIALGGIGAATLPDLAGVGVRGIAIMGEAMASAAPEIWFETVLRIWLRVRVGG